MTLKVKFIPTNIEVEVESETKILVAARKGKVPIRFGCASCRCGTCAVEVSDDKKFKPMDDEEKKLLKKMKLSLKGDVRLSCQARVIEDGVVVDIDFQDTYDPDIT